MVFNSENELIVSEFGNNRLQVFDSDGNHLRFLSNGTLDGPCQICLDAHENIYVRNQSKGPYAKVQVVGKETGEIIHTFAEDFGDKF